MKKYVRKIIAIFLIINILLSYMNVGVFKLFAAEDISAIFSQIDINFIDPETQDVVDGVNVGELARMQISLGVASNIDTDSTSIRIDLSNDNFYFTSFTPNGDSDGATYSVTVEDSTQGTKTLTAVLHIDADGTRYITIDDLVQGSTVHLSLDGYFKDTVTPNEKLSVSVGGQEYASISATNVANKITVDNSKTVSTDKISYHKGNTQDLSSNFPITYGISANVMIPDAWADTETLKNLTIDDTLSFPASMYIENSGSVDLSNFIGLGTNSVLTISDFSPVLSSDETKIVGIKLNKVLTSTDIDTYLANGEEISLKYNDNLVIEGDGTISNTLSTSYESTNFTGSANPVTKTTTIDETTGADFENTTKKLSDGGINSNTASGGPGWFSGYLIEGDEITYKISTTNTGDEIGNVKLTDVIPTGTVLVEAKSDNTTDINSSATVTIDGEEKNAVIWSFSNVPAGQTVTATIRIKITDNSDFTLVNNLYKDEDYTKIETTGPELQVNKKRPNLEISKSAESSGGEFSNPGDSISYTITVKNSGTETITTSVTDSLPDSLENIICTDQDNAVIENGTITWNNVTLDIGESITYNVTGTVKEGTTGSITNTATADKNGEYEKNATVTTEVFDETVVLNNTTISKIVNKANVNTGDSVSYNIQLKNTGKKYNLADITGEKIVVTDVIPDGITYSSGAYYLLPNDSTQYTEGITYDEITKTITWELDSSIYNEFSSNAVVNLYIPCTVTQESSEDQDIIINNKASSTTLNKETNEVPITILKSSGLEIEKYVDKVYDNTNKDNLLYENKTGSNKEQINIDFQEGYLAIYKVKISNSAKTDITLDSTNGTFTDEIQQLSSINSDGSIIVNVYDSEGNKYGDSVTTYAYDGKSFTINLSGRTIKAKDYIVLSYELQGATNGVSKATNKISNNTLESSSQDLINKPEMNKSVAIVDKQTDWQDASWNNNSLQTYLSNLEFKDTANVSATSLENKYLIYKIHSGTGENLVDKYTVTDTISNNLNFVKDITTYNYSGLLGTGPVFAIYRNDSYSWGSTTSGMINFQASPKISIDDTGKKLNIEFNLTSYSATSTSFDIYYLVEVDQTKLQEMITNIENGIDIDSIDLLNEANVKSTNVDESGKPLIDFTDDTKVNVNDGILYPGIEKEYTGFFGSGETKVDSEGNVQLSTGSANAGANLVWQVTVDNADKDSAKSMRNYTVNDILPGIYEFDARFLDDTYTGAKYYPSIVIYKKDGSEKKSWKGKDFILPTGYENSNELTWNFEGEDYYLDPGEKMVIKFSTKVKSAGSYGAFLNTARLTTTSEFTKENIGNGVQISDKTIENTDFANVYSYMTTSYKEIEYNPDLYDASYEQPLLDTGISKKDENGILDNYVEGHQGELVKYTLNVKNESKVNIKDLAIIDRLPYVGDIGVIAKYPRDSAFEVKWDSFIKADIYDKDGNFSRTIDNNKVKITFSDEKNSTFEYGCKDWYGENDVATWTNEANEQTVNVRFMIDYNKDDNQTFLQPGENIKLTFYGRVPKYIQKTGNSNVAWNNFAYGYKAYNANTDLELSNLSIAEPAKVGVWVKENKVVNPGTIKINKTYNAGAGDTGEATVYLVLYKYNDNYDAFDPNSIEYEKYSSIVSINVEANSTNSYTFDNLPSGTKYKIYETDKYGNILDANNNDWYTIEGQGTEVELIGGDLQEVNITDTALEEFKGSIKINKKVFKYTGEEVTDGTYTFVLKDESGNYVYEKDGNIVKSKEFTSDAIIHTSAGKSRTINNLDIGTYKIYEVNEDGTNVNYVEGIGYKVEFSPSNEVNITRSDGNQEITATNTLDREPVNVSLQGKKYLENQTLSAEQFEFELTQTDESKNETLDQEGNVIKYVAKNDADGDFKFDLQFNEVGEYYYKLNEVNDGNSKYIYDENIYFIKISVTEESKVLVSNIEILEGGTDISFNNEFLVEKISLQVEKVWNDNNNQDGKRPTNIQVQLKADGVNYGEAVTLTAGLDNIWQEDELKYTWNDLIKYDNEREIVYTIEEINVPDGYNATYNTETTGKTIITNTHTPEVTTYEVEKVWSDNENQDGKRPENIIVQLKANGTNSGNAITLTAGEDKVWQENELKYTWTALPKYENGTLITYTVEETSVIDGYSTTYNTETTGKTVITNTHTPEVTTYEVEKVWSDNNNQDGKRAESITVQLKANGINNGEAVTLNYGDNNIWDADELKYVWSNLPKYADGTLITYTVEEISVIDGYTATYNTETTGKTVITNTHTPEVTTYEVEKVWSDNDNQDGKRPENITVQLKANGVNSGNAITLAAGEDKVWQENELKYTWTDLPKYANGTEIIYTAQETSVLNGYDVSYNTETTGKTIITNTHTPETTTYEVEKVWLDNNNQDGKRPENIQVQLKANGVNIGSAITLTSGEDEEWQENELKYTWTALPKYENGTLITYTVEEKSVIKGYNATYNTETTGKTIIINMYETEKTQITVEKVWDDSNDENSKRPESIQVQLKANSINSGGVVTLTAGEDKVWQENELKYTWTNLPKYADGIEIIYTVEEVSVPEGYEVNYNTETTGKTIITNKHTVLIDISGTKTWIDYNNADNTRPTSIKVNLMKNGVKEDSKEITAANNWKYSFTGLEKYDDENNEIKYTITEEKIDGYESEINGYDITNTYKAIISIEGTKTWIDYDNKDNTRPESITVNLLKNGTKIKSKIVTELDGWKYSFTELEKYDDKNNAILYTVEEENVDNYKSKVDGYNITNTYKAETSIEATKTWVDHNNVDHTRPESVTVNLLKDGVKIKSAILTDKNNWKYTFENLEKYDQNNQEIKYSIEEENVNGYRSEINGYNITNTFIGRVTTSISGKKIWYDYNNIDNTRPESITVNLLKDGVKIDSKIVTEEENWEYVFTDLDKYNDNDNEIKYTVTEDEVNGYKTEVEGYDIINTYVAKTSVEGKKIWIDDENVNNTRPESITINLLKDGIKIKSKVITEDNDWKYVFTNLVKYNEDGTEISYTVAEDKVKGYTSKIDGTNIINTYIPIEENTEEKEDIKQEIKEENKEEQKEEKHYSVKTGDNIIISFMTLIASIAIEFITRKIINNKSKNK